MPSPIVFAQRGASSIERPNSMEAFTLALRLGATGIESDVCITADGVVVLDHLGVTGRRFRRRDIGSLRRAELPDHVTPLDDLLDTLRGTDVHLSLAIDDPAGVGRVIDQCAGEIDTGRLWLSSRELDLLSALRDTNPLLQLVHTTSLSEMKPTPERHAAELRTRRISAVRLRHADWSTGLTALFGRFTIRRFAWGLEHTRQIRDTVGHGVDGIAGGHVDRMVAALGR